MSIKKILIYFSITLIFSILVVLFDFANYDSSYINRSPITFSINNVNSKKTQKIYGYLNNFYNRNIIKFSHKHKKYWEVEDASLRLNLPKKKIIKGKIKNFKDGQKLDEIEKNFENWPRSHGGFSSMRFSSLDLLIIFDIRPFVGCGACPNQAKFNISINSPGQ